MKIIFSPFFRSWGLALGIGFLGFLIVFPSLFFFQEFPMAQGTWELEDPAVTGLIFLPGQRVLRWEYLLHHNWFWTNLRALGVPLLGNEIQAAPVFPLTLLLFPIPEPFYWTVLVVLRSSLIASLCFLIAKEVFRFSFTGAVTFMVTTGFGLFTLRWLNHPWTNGFLASLFYLYVLLRPLVSGWDAWKGLSTKKFLLQVLAVYSMVTCGFPEASILGAFLAIFLWTPAFLTAAFRREIQISQELLVLALSHLAGFLLSSPQFLALLEYLNENGPSFRSGPGLIQIASLRDFFKMITRTNDGPPKTTLIHYFNLIPITFGLYGLIPTLTKWNRWAVGALLCLAFGILKFFPTWSGFNQFFGTLPLLEGVWFYLYLFPLLLFGFGYLVARGVDAWREDRGRLPKQRIQWVAATAIAVVIFILAGAIDPTLKWERYLKLSLLFVVFLLGASFLKQIRWLSFWILVFVSMELISTRPPHFLKYEEQVYKDAYGMEKVSELENLLKAQGIDPQGIRELSLGGQFVSAGIATLNNGSPPMVPLRLRQLLRTLFELWPGWDVAMPVRAAKFSHSHRMLGINLYTESDLPFVHPQFPKLDLEWKGKNLWHDIYYDSQAFPRAYLAGRCKPVKNMEEGMGVIGNTTFRLGDVALENLSQKESDLCSSLNQKYVAISIGKDLGSEVDLIEVKGPGVLVLSDTYHPGWRAVDTLSGKTLEIKPANVALRGIMLEDARDYRVRFEYIPTWWPRSKILFLLGVVIVLLTGWVFSLKRLEVYSEGYRHIRTADIKTRPITKG